jgi:hypothetical protein
MKTALAVAIVFLAGSLALSQDGPVVSLCDAARSGHLAVRGTEPDSYRQVTLTLGNRTGAPLRVDLAGSYLVPRKRGSCQRLGLGPAITPLANLSSGGGKVIVTLAAGEEVVLRVATVCLDAGLPCPPMNGVFEPADDPLPPVREGVMRWWADHPDAPQGAVNCSIWQNRAEVTITGLETPAYGRPTGLHTAAFGGVCYRLKDGELLSRDAEGVTRFLGTRIFSVLPAADGVYAVGMSGAGGPELWRLALTGEEPWARVGPVDPRSHALDVLRGGKETVLLTGFGVDLVGSHPARPLLAGDEKRAGDCSAMALPSDRWLTVRWKPGSPGIRQAGETRLERQGTIDLFLVGFDGARDVKRFWNVREAKAGAAGILGLSHAGRLKRLVDDDFRDLPGEKVYARLLAVAGATAWLVDGDGKLAVVDAKTGALRHTVDLAFADLAEFRADPVTGDLAATREGGTCLRVKAADGTVEAIRFGE